MSHKIINYCLLTANVVAFISIGAYIFRKTKALEKREEICNLRERIGQEISPDENNGSFIIVGRSIWDVNLETDCLYPVTYVNYAKKKASETKNGQVKKEWIKAVKQWTNAAHKWRETVQKLKPDDDQESENTDKLDEIADKLTAEMCSNLAQRYIRAL